MNTVPEEKQLFSVVRWECPVCGSERAVDSLTTKDYNHRVPGDFTYAKCSECGLWRQNPRPDNQTLGNAYPLHYGSSLIAKNDPEKRINCLANKKRFSFVQKYTKKPLSIFDIGCGSGFFLAFLKKQGWKVGGIDSAQEHVLYANEKLGLNNVYHAQWPGYTSDEVKYDVVSLIHTLEHLPDPASSLKAASALLKPGGYLLIETPNINAFARFLYGKRCNLFDAPRHLCLFSEATLKRVVQSAGMNCVKMCTYSPSLDGYIESLRYVLQDLKLRTYRKKSEVISVDESRKAENKNGTSSVTGVKNVVHYIEKGIDRSIDSIASLSGGGLTILALVKKV